jgi:hypothetical protein
MDSDDLRRIGRGLLRALAYPRRGGSVPMKIRACVFGMIAVVSLTSGCACCDNPCWGFRLHPWSSHCGSPCGGCCPAYSSPVSAPVVYRSPNVTMSSPDCPCNGTPVINHPTVYPGSGYPGTYSPIIGNPMPLPGTPGVAPKDMVPNPMPVKN